MRALSDWNTWISRALLAGAAAIIFLLGFLVCADVIGRAVFNSPVKGTPEMVSMSIVIICFLLAGYAVQSGGMIYADVLVSIFGWRGQAFALLLSSILGFLFFGLIVWGSYEPTLHAISSGEYEGEGALRVPVWPARTVVLLGSILVLLAYLSHGARAVVSLVTGKPQGDMASGAPHP
jgi:TRAP-type C4-dicarboxylate transport system permease small subunit